MTDFRLKGLIAAPFTAFLPNGELNLDMVPRQADALIRHGVAGAFLCGTTGEGLSLTSEERGRVLEAWAAAAPDSFPLAVHVGHQSLKEAQALARQAEAQGAAAIAAVGPTFYRPGSVEELADYCAELAEAAPSLPFYYYHIPPLTRIELPMSEFLPAAGSRVATFAGVKFSHDDLFDFARCQTVGGGQFDLLFGRDEFLLAAVALGAKNAVGSTYNFMAPLYERMLRLWREGKTDDAQREQLRSAAVVACCYRHGMLPAAKAILSFQGLDCGPVRSPLRNLSEKERAAFRTELESIAGPDIFGE